MTETSTEAQALDKCAHSPCTCRPSGASLYCSTHCQAEAERESAANLPDEQCLCGHADCQGSQGSIEGI